MNQMKGGDKGARLMDTRGLPDQAYRTGRTIFQDPSKSQGFFGDLRTMAGDLSPLSRRPNPAAIHVNEYNPFPKAGFGADWYKDEFGSFDPSGLFEGILKLATPLKYFKGKERTPLERDSAFTPVPGSADWESSVFDPIEGEFEEEIDLSPGTDWYGPYNEDWEKLQAYHRGDLERNEDIERIFFDETIDDGSQEIEIKEDEFNIELSPDRKQELRDLLLSPEFQARPYHEQKEILEGFGWTEPDLLSGLQ